MYFDGCYFDPAYFDASECVAPPTPSGGKAGHGNRIAQRRRAPRRPEPEPLLDDEEAIMVLLL